jgi:hypothetical protein
MTTAAAIAAAVVFFVLAFVALLIVADKVRARRRALAEDAARRTRWRAAGVRPLQVRLAGETGSWHRIGESRWWRPLGSGESGWFELDSDLVLATDDGGAVMLQAGSRVVANEVDVIRRTAALRVAGSDPQHSFVTGAELCAGRPFWLLGIPCQESGEPYRTSGVTRLAPLDALVPGCYLAAPQPERLSALC